jgi:hypothetical protein
LTAVGARVAAHSVAVITTFSALDLAISTAQGSALIVATVAVDLITVVTALNTDPQEAITAARLLTGCGTAVVVSLITVITLLSASAHDPITASRERTGLSTRVSGVEVTVVALLDPAPDETIATARDLTE